MYREAVVFCELQELSYEEAAEAIGCPVGTVRSRLHRGRAMLLVKLQSLKKKQGVSMTCEQIREQLVETARGRELSSDLRAIVFSHAAGCIGLCAEAGRRNGS